MANLSLYKLTDIWQEIYDSIDAETGEVSPELMESIYQVDQDINQKIDGICSIISSCDAVVEACKKEAQRLNMRAHSHSVTVEKLKRYLKEQLEKLGERKRKTLLHSVSICNSPMSVNVVDINAVPNIYDKAQERQVDKRFILDAMKQGEIVPGCELTQGTHLRIS